MLATVYLFYPCNKVSAASAKTTYEINGQLSVYLSKQTNPKQANIKQYVNILLIEKIITNRKTTKVTLAESGFKLISKQPMPFKLSYPSIPKYSKNTTDSPAHYNLHVVIANNKNGTPIVATITSPIIANRNYRDLHLAFQALPKPVK